MLFIGINFAKYLSTLFNDLIFFDFIILLAIISVFFNKSKFIIHLYFSK